MIEEQTLGDRRAWDGLGNVEQNKQEELTHEKIQAFRNRELRLCQQEVLATLLKYRCDLVAYPVIIDGKLDAQVKWVLK